ncbi:hypothetical protein GLOTRDRAFT_130818 [Gloeophyllum trabeum ATCC 11539]|uniref:Uncharacterized protein n=1 Tax=Gloeophyllum trabeum (strain ATCC 11539 / FP-39264 / Madison 617) TaxID=670483 RepID=S7RH04_GLOTA|nr:uncharacterized protein GLOTRDRAFT_130818 [Gloeophyllum trabeum ATCC 11539]EPQ53480.1 hypothetical protein GLOTRDRAFT_130818 [Gloeophyllum trabeum ATCC 11539]
MAGIASTPQLTSSSSYNYYAPVALADGTTVSEEKNQQILLGQLSREERDETLRLAKAIRFSKTSVINSCRTWTRDLLKAMVERSLITVELFDKIDTKVPLKKRVTEV